VAGALNHHRDLSRIHTIKLCQGLDLAVIRHVISGGRTRLRGGRVAITDYWITARILPAPMYSCASWRPEIERAVRRRSDWHSAIYRWRVVPKQRVWSRSGWASYRPRGNSQRTLRSMLRHRGTHQNQQSLSLQRTVVRSGLRTLVSTA